MSGAMRGRRVLAITLAFFAISAVHAGVGRGTHALHIVHVVFGSLYLLPIVAAAVRVGTRAAIALATASAAAYVVHARTAWAGQPMENANQLAMASVYLFVGVVSAVLVRAAEHERRRHAEAERRSQRDALVRGIASLSSALRHRDDGTGAHCERVSRLVVSIGMELGLGVDRLEVLRLAALAHDVGKIGVRDDVLQKPDELTAEERSRIERHPTIAADILRPIRGVEEVADIVLCHHECPDGSGYPRHLVAERIALESRILRVADVFDALVSARPYKRGVAPAEAIVWMHSLVGKVDASALAALEHVLARGADDLAGKPLQLGAEEPE
jgi:putative nucleotidyltransferase with HDIG domain